MRNYARERISRVSIRCFPEILLRFRDRSRRSIRARRTNHQSYNLHDRLSVVHHAHNKVVKISLVRTADNMCARSPSVIHDRNTNTDTRKDHRRKLRTVIHELRDPMEVVGSTEGVQRALSKVSKPSPGQVSPQFRAP